MARPKSGDYGDFYAGYIQATEPANSIHELIQTFSQDINNFYANLPEEKADYRYEDSKWSIKQLLQHIIDADRIFGFRALTFARKDVVNLVGFDENAYAENADGSERTLTDLKEELLSLRKSTDKLLQSFSEQQLNEKGIASNHSISVNALCFIIYGHLLHHKKILTERYL
ncbi:MAG: DinB family protein [Chitinophagaceae bacterium]